MAERLTKTPVLMGISWFALNAMWGSFVSSGVTALEKVVLLAASQTQRNVNPTTMLAPLNASCPFVEIFSHHGAVRTESTAQLFMTRSTVRVCSLLSYEA